MEAFRKVRTIREASAIQFAVEISEKSDVSIQKSQKNRRNISPDKGDMSKIRIKIQEVTFPCDKK